ncbi:MAG: exodeoxyribonuclease VII [Gracilibacter sp. BRH_c7a]|nr:MAG: exodeoxyribonuclease VII [Gracilibacter sp. BRH_c7a]
MDNKNPISFEQGIEKLEQIISDLDKNDVPLDQALQLFNEGIVLVKHCNCLLDSAEEKVKVLLEDANGEFSTDKFIISGEGQ